MFTEILHKAKAVLSREMVWSSLVVGLFALVLILPQWLGGQFVAGSDLLFHYNRFYETAQQMATGNYSYMISLFSFQQSGRIINALYGPFFAYFQGFLVLLSPSWWAYQLLTRWLIASLAGLSLFRLLRRAKVSSRLAISMGLVYMTTYAIQYWTYRQGFTSWGAALLPWCLIPAIDYVQTRRISAIRLGVSVALMLQVHVLSVVFLILGYLLFFAYGFVKDSHKWRSIRQLALAIGLFALLSLNVIVPLLSVNGSNSLIQPFVNKNMAINTIDKTASHWLVAPALLSLLLVIYLIGHLRQWKRLSVLTRLAFVNFALFSFAASSLFPWTLAQTETFSSLTLIQFPFRFFVPALSFLFLGLGRLADEADWKLKRRSALTYLVALAAVLGLVQVQLTIPSLHTSRNEYNTISESKHLRVEGTVAEVRQAFHAKDKQALLTIALKSTPDYLPKVNLDQAKGYRPTTINNYDVYDEVVIKKNDTVTKTVEGSSLVLTWTSTSEEAIELPVVAYADSIVILNGKHLSAKDYDRGLLGTVIVRQQSGQNTLRLSYQTPSLLVPALVISGLGWGLLVIYGAYRFYHSQRQLAKKDG